MAKKTITAVLICILLISTFVVPSMAYVNPYIALTANSAMLMLPYFDSWAIETEFLPLDFEQHVNDVLLTFKSIYPYELYPIDEDTVEIFQDEALTAFGTNYYGLGIDTFSQEIVGGTSFTVIEFAIYEYDESGENIGDIAFGSLTGVVDVSTIWTQIFVGDILTDPNDVSEFFAYMYPYLPLHWPAYSKIINGTYQSGFADGEKRGAQRINLKEVNAAFERGKAQGYDEGYRTGFYDAGGKNYFKELVDAVIFAPVNGIVEMMNFDFFGINVANFFLALLTILILAGILALIARFIL